MKYIFVTGGVISSLGKGIAAASIGNLLEGKNLKVTLLKFDPYINVDPGTLSPYQHGEVYVTDDGAETDLDLGHYERFTTASMRKENNVTAGKIYYSVIEKERRGDYLGQTVQVVPHITEQIKEAIRNLKDASVVIVEIGGTVGDIESLPFLEAARQFRHEVGKDNAIFIHLTYVPFIEVSEEIKTKPTQHSVRTLREIGISPDILLCRTKKPLGAEIRKKIATFCDVEYEAVIEARDVECVYEVPLMFKSQALDTLIIDMLRLKDVEEIGENIEWQKKWEEIVRKAKNPSFSTNVALVGKYIKLKDSYKSIIEALNHGGIANDAKVHIKWVDAESINSQEDARELLKGVDAVLVPGGFGERGVDGKIEVVRYARENEIPFFGICLGLQCAVIEFAKNVVGLKDAHSKEFDPLTPHPVIDLLEEQKKIKKLGGTMRLGAYPCKILDKDSFAFSSYKTSLVYERHRHRYEFNIHYQSLFESKGMKFSGIYADGELVEIIEVFDHPWFLATQFHPEFKSRPYSPHPLFKEFIRMAIDKSGR